MKVIITGMHRSGTSMLAGLLQICGLDLGSNFATLGKAKREGNEKGLFEDLDFKWINKTLLRRNGGGSFDPPKNIEIDPYIHNIIEDFLSVWNKPHPVGWKDPRACLTLHIWKKFIPMEDLRVVVITRPVEEIAASLKMRNGFEFKKSKRVAFIYLSRLFKELEDMKWIGTAYHKYFRTWKKELKFVCDFLNLEIPENTQLIDGFIDWKLWHHRINP